MAQWTRRNLLRAGAATLSAGAAIALLKGTTGPVLAGGMPEGVPAGPRPAQDATVEVLHPAGRVPMSFIIDDSTCLVNMGHFCMPQFNAAWPQRFEYKKPWKNWPREIPDNFVREFGTFCAEQGIKGKYSLVPYPACVGWLDRELPGWSKKELQDSLKLVRELMVPSWDITPEMVTHTRLIDLKTGRPMPEMTAATMENSWPQEKKSADEFAAYIVYALRILKNCDIPCTGVTTPGGFGNIAKPELSLGMRQAVADVFAPEVPFYFKYVADGKDEFPRPKLEHVEGLESGAPKFIVNVPSGTGDHFSNWDGDLPPDGDKYANADASAGRMVDLIESNEPAIMFGHWAGLYSNGSKAGFEAFKKVASALNTKYRDRTTWMKVSEIARYWAARELTRIERLGNKISLAAPVATPRFTMKVAKPGGGPPSFSVEGKAMVLEEVAETKLLRAGTWLRGAESVTICFDLAKGVTSVLA